MPDASRSPAGSPSMASPLALRLSVAVLFGDDFLSSSDPEFIESLCSNSAHWANVMRAVWSVMGSSQHDQVNGTRAASSPGSVAGRAHAVGAGDGGLKANGNTRVGGDLTGAAPGGTCQASPLTSEASTDVVSPYAPAAAVSGGVSVAPSAGAESETVLFYEPEEEEVPGEQGDGAAPAAVLAAVPKEEITERLVALLVEASGYPAEVFASDLDLEVDLGIDSVNQVHVITDLREHYGLPMDKNFKMRDYSTVGKLANYISGRLGAPLDQTAPSPE
jgi:acyl carrier protein